MICSAIFWLWKTLVRNNFYNCVFLECAAVGSFWLQKEFNLPSYITTGLFLGWRPNCLVPLKPNGRTAAYILNKWHWQSWPTTEKKRISPVIWQNTEVLQGFRTTPFIYCEILRGFAPFPKLVKFFSSNLFAVPHPQVCIQTILDG